MTASNKIAGKSLVVNKSRNIFLITAIFMTAYSLATMISLSIGYKETRMAYYIRRDGSYFDENLGIDIVFVIVGIFLVIVGFLFIYNVMSVSVSKDVRFYGLLKMLGMTPKQIRSTVIKQILILSVIGIALGLIAAALTSLVFVPGFSKLAMQNLTEADIVISFNPMIYIGAALFAFITALIGAFRPAKKAAEISAIEAVRFAEYGYEREEIRSSPFNPLKIAWRNVFRVKKRAVLVFVSLSAGMSMFLIVTVITWSMHVNMDATIQENAELKYGGCDVRLTNWAMNQAFTPEIMEKTNALPGLTDINIKYIAFIETWFFYDREFDYRSPGEIHSLDKSEAARLNENVHEPFDEAAFMRGEFVIVRDTGDPRLLGFEYIEFYLRNSDELLSFKIGGFELPQVIGDWGINSMPKIYMPESLLREFVSDPVIYQIELFIEKDKQKHALDLIIEWTGDIESVWRTSSVEIREDSENGTALLAILGGGISFVFCFIGILNFVNIISTGILSRRHELALFESIGQSKKQTIKMLTFEGMIYALISLILTCIFGGALSYWLFWLAFGMYEWFVFGFPYPFVIMVLIIFIICLSIPRIIYRSIRRKSTVVERLREIE